MVATQKHCRNGPKQCQGKDKKDNVNSRKSFTYECLMEKYCEEEEKEEKVEQNVTSVWL